MIMKNNTTETITFFKQIDGDIYPEVDLPENARKLRGLNWRGEERIKTKDEIFSEEDNEMNDKLVKEGEIDKGKKSTPMKIRKETLNYDKKKKK